MRVYYDRDCDINLIKDKKVATEFARLLDQAEENVREELRAEEEGE